LVRRNETFPPVTMGHTRGHGCRDLLVYCISGRCHHSVTMNGDWLPDETPVRSLCSRMVCTRCGKVRDLYADFTSVTVPPGAAQGFAVATPEVVFRGLCQDCQATTD